MDYEVIVLYITTLIVSFVNGDKAFPFTLFGLHVLDSLLQWSRFCVYVVLFPL